MHVVKIKTFNVIKIFRKLKDLHIQIYTISEITNIYILFLLFKMILLLKQNFLKRLFPGLESFRFSGKEFMLLEISTTRSMKN